MGQQRSGDRRPWPHNGCPFYNGSPPRAASGSFETLKKIVRSKVRVGSCTIMLCRMGYGFYFLSEANPRVTMPALPGFMLHHPAVLLGPSSGLVTMVT